MSKDKIIVPYGLNEQGQGKALVFQPDQNRPEDLQFALEVERVGQTKPRNLQEFFERLVELQKKGTV